MKPTQIFVLVATTAVFLLTFFVASGFPTGFSVAQKLSLNSIDVRAYENDALITWQTSKEAISTIVVDNQRTAFQSATTFSKETTGLKPGTRYDFVIRACDENACKEKKSSFQTRGASSDGTAITGALVGGNGVTEIVRTSINMILYLMLGLTAVVVFGKIGYEKLSVNRDPVGGFVRRAQKHLQDDQYKEAYQVYSQAREAFKGLEDEAKLRHYDSLLTIYQSLKKYAVIGEAQRLAQKYETGTITKEEMRRLNELLAE